MDGGEREGDPDKAGGEAEDTGGEKVFEEGCRPEAGLLPGDGGGGRGDEVGESQGEKSSGEGTAEGGGE